MLKKVILTAATAALLSAAFAPLAQAGTNHVTIGLTTTAVCDGGLDRYTVTESGSTTKSLCVESVDGAQNRINAAIEAYNVASGGTDFDIDTDSLVAFKGALYDWKAADGTATVVGGYVNTNPNEFAQHKLDTQYQFLSMAGTAQNMHDTQQEDIDTNTDDIAEVKGAVGGYVNWNNDRVDTNINRLNVHEARLDEQGAEIKRNSSRIAEHDRRINGNSSAIAVNAAEISENSRKIDEIRAQVSASYAQSTAVAHATSGGDGIGFGVGSHEDAAVGALSISKSFGAHAVSLSATTEGTLGAGYKLRF